MEEVWKIVVVAQTAAQANETIKLTTVHKKRLHGRRIRSYHPAEPAHVPRYGRCVLQNIEFNVCLEDDDGCEQEQCSLATFLQRAQLPKREDLRRIQVQRNDTDGSLDSHWELFPPPHDPSPEVAQLRQLHIEDIYLTYRPHDLGMVYRCCRLNEEDILNRFTG